MAITPREDFNAGGLRALARKSGNAAQSRRLLSLAAIYDGASRAQAARIGGLTRQIVRDRVVKFNTMGPDGLINGKAPDDHRGSTIAFASRSPK